MRKYISKLDGVDPERGDTLIAPWSGAIGQLVRLPKPEQAGRVIQSFVRWGKGGDRETLKDPWEDAALSGLIEEQQAATRKYFRTCHNRERKEDGATYVETNRDNTTQVVNKTKPKDNLNANNNSSCFSEGDNISRNGHEPSAHVATMSVEGAKKFLAMNAVDVSSNSVMHDTTTGDVSALYKSILNADDPIYVVTEAIGNDLFADEKRREAWYELLDPICDGIKDKNTLLKVVVKAWDDCKRNQSVKNPPGFIIERVKRLSSALNALKKK